jgi:hypothetical protein
VIFHWRSRALQAELDRRSEETLERLEQHSKRALHRSLLEEHEAVTRLGGAGLMRVAQDVGTHALRGEYRKAAEVARSHPGLSDAQTADLFCVLRRQLMYDLHRNAAHGLYDSERAERALNDRLDDTVGRFDRTTIRQALDGPFARRLLQDAREKSPEAAMGKVAYMASGKDARTDIRIVLEGAVFRYACNRARESGLDEEVVELVRQNASSRWMASQMLWALRNGLEEATEVDRADFGIQADLDEEPPTVELFDVRSGASQRVVARVPELQREPARLPSFDQRRYRDIRRALPAGYEGVLDGIAPDDVLALLDGVDEEQSALSLEAATARAAEFGSLQPGRLVQGLLGARDKIDYDAGLYL